ncbi:MAG: hypothetical protein NC900_04115 [Candidatus Omnitrophica bacterium]|nr:hypothetical protein [Candidatus Omnitrophota bacterium]
MLNKNLNIFIFIILILANLRSYAVAADNYSFSISCVIPAIPGVNAPLEEKTEYTQKQEKEEQTVSENVSISAGNKKDGFVLKTIYSR